jgi:hypothetical protein
MRVIHGDGQQTIGECLDEGHWQSQSQQPLLVANFDLENAQLSAVHIICRKVHGYMFVQ